MNNDPWVTCNTNLKTLLKDWIFTAFDAFILFSLSLIFLWGPRESCLLKFLVNSTVIRFSWYLLSLNPILDLDIHTPNLIFLFWCQTNLSPNLICLRFWLYLQETEHAQLFTSIYLKKEVKSCWEAEQHLVNSYGTKFPSNPFCVPHFWLPSGAEDGTSSFTSRRQISVSFSCNKRKDYKCLGREPNV